MSSRMIKLSPAVMNLQCNSVRSQGVTWLNFHPSDCMAPLNPPRVIWSFFRITETAEHSYVTLTDVDTCLPSTCDVNSSHSNEAFGIHFEVFALANFWIEHDTVRIACRVHWSLRLLSALPVSNPTVWSFISHEDIRKNIDVATVNTEFFESACNLSKEIHRFHCFQTHDRHPPFHR
jgi:hypothetical protein